MLRSVMMDFNGGRVVVSLLDGIALECEMK